MHIARDAGSFGSKLTGGGGGGAIIAISDKPSDIVEAFDNEGFNQFIFQCTTVTENDMEKLILVDEYDQEIGSELKEDCHLGEGILHRAFSVFIFTVKKKC